MPVQNVKQPSEPKGIVANKCNFGVVTPSEKKLIGQTTFNI